MVGVRQPSPYLCIKELLLTEYVYPCTEDKTLCLAGNARVAFKDLDEGREAGDIAGLLGVVQDTSEHEQ